MTDEPEDLTMDATMPEAADSDALLVAAYVKQVELPELRRYIAMDLITALNPWTDKTVAQAKQVEAFLMGRGPKAVE